MKKVVSIVLALVLALALVAIAEAVPSKTTADMTTFTTEAEGLVIAAVETEEADAELEALASKTLDEYFGEEAIAAAKEITGNDSLEICEFMSIIVNNYKEEMGDVKANVKFATAFDKDAKVAAMVGLGGEWTALEGTALEDGSVDFVFPGDLLAGIQETGAFFAALR